MSWTYTLKRKGDGIQEGKGSHPRLREQIIYLEKPWGSRVQYTRPGWSGTAGGVSCLPLTWLCDLGQVAGCLSVPLPYLLSGGNASTTQLIVSARTKWVSIYKEPRAAVGPDVSVENELITSFYIRYHARSSLVLAKEDRMVGGGWWRSARESSGGDAGDKLGTVTQAFGIRSRHHFLFLGY